MSKKLLGLSCAMCIGAVLSACGAKPADSTPQESPHSERGGIGVTLSSHEQALIVVNQRSSLAVTDLAILNDTTVDPSNPSLPTFTLPAVLNQLAGQMGTGQSPHGLFQQLWDTQNAAPGLSGQPGPHCTDNGGTLNTFPYQCRAEGNQASPTSPLNETSYIPIGLFNRFDLAPDDGANCGEYRIVFGVNPGAGAPGRNFIIFEAVLPNPTPGLGLEGCRQVQNFWVNLATMATASARALALRNFYFVGLSGFPPVISIKNYGFNPQSWGQIRTNQFFQIDWLLHEFKLLRPACGGPICPFEFISVTDKTNPYGDLFNPASPQPLAPIFQNSFFPSQVASLAVYNINTFNYSVPDQYNTGESDSQDALQNTDQYDVQLGAGPSPFRANIQNQLTILGSPLTPDDIVARAQALSCAGCHQLSNGANLGGGLVWPNSLGFTHTSETTTEPSPFGTRFVLSPALTGVFLPHREQVAETFLNAPTLGAAFVSQSVPGTVTHGTSFTVSITLQNTGTETWSVANGFQLGSQSPAGNTTWGLSWVNLAATDSILWNGQKTFTFTATAPAAVGTYTFQWQMNQGGPTWFGALTPAVSINVI